MCSSPPSPARRFAKSCRTLPEWWRSSAAAPRISLRSHASAACPWCSACSTRRAAFPTGPWSRSTAWPASFAGCNNPKGEAVAARAKVVITDYVWESLDVERKTLGELAEIVALKTNKAEEFLTEARDCDALLNTYAGPITAETMAGMPKCKIIARYGIGVDTIDLDAATRAGIIVTNNPTYCIEEVAEQTLGLIGFGNIARAVAARAAAFGLAVLYSDPFVKEGQFKVPGKAVDLDTLLRDSDFVSLHPPLTPQTRKMIGEDALGKMKRTAFLINCARGPIVDTDALVRALDAKTIAGAALDTVDPEPLPDPHPLRGRDNVILNPHVAWYSEQAMAGLQAGAPGEVRRVLSGEWPVNVVNRAVKAKNRAGL